MTRLCTPHTLRLSTNIQSDATRKVASNFRKSLGTIAPTVCWDGMRDNLERRGADTLIHSDVIVHLSSSRWSAEGARDLLKRCSSAESSATTSRVVHEMCDAYNMGLISPLQVVDALHTISTSATQNRWRDALRRIEYARYLSLNHNHPFRDISSPSLTTDSVPWFDLFPSDVVSRIRKCSVSVQEITSPVFPHTLHTANTSNSRFNTTQKALVHDGAIPTDGAQMRFWLMFLMCHLPSIENAVTTAYTEICTYCRVRVDAADCDSSYIVPLLFMLGVMECLELIQELGSVDINNRAVVNSINIINYLEGKMDME